MSKNLNSGLRAVLDALNEGQSILVTSHTSPDGDAVGSLLAMAHFVRALGKQQVTCSLADPTPRAYTWLPGAQDIVPPGSLQATFDVVVIIDAHQCSRIGEVEKLITESTTLIALDHHLAETIDAPIHVVNPSYAAACEIVIDLFELAGLPISREAAECAYVALITDTGSFRYSNTNPRAHRTAARLLEAGVDVAEISARIFDTMTRPRFDLLGRVLQRAHVSPNGLFASAQLTLADMEETGAKGEDVDGLINYLRNIEGVQLAALFREAGPGITKVSFRARPPVNCAEMLREFGGGGHAAAAGATLQRPMKEAVAAVMAALPEHIKGPE
ncbi:MAG: bifunctional oligoribonuclease/PAP phosphatase NrnA [Candidatus Hydrogenedentes bacterium]|nr:bifunctional oligoribonuclease/PAP phosphatase NrnA [Candidatus Hydrogenedentota bacterium]